MVIAVPTYKIAYMALPKAGCSSVKQALARIDPDVTVPDQDVIHFDTWHEIYPTTRFRPHRWEAYNKPGWFRFCVVRDPVKRLLSVYTNRVVQLGELKNSRKILSGEVNLPTTPDPDYFFRNLDAYRAASSTIKHHAMKTWLFIGPKPLLYDRVYKTEELGELAQDLSRHSGRNVVMPRSNSSDMKLTLDDLRPHTIDAIRPFLNFEYDFLSDFYDNPLS